MNESGDSAQLAIDETERENEEKTKKDEGETLKTPQGQAADKESEEGEKREKTRMTEEETSEAQKSSAEDRISFEDMKRAHAEVLNEKDRENALLKKQLEEARKINVERQNQPGKLL